MTFCGVNTLIPQGEVSYIQGKCSVGNSKAKLPTHRILPDVITGYPLYSGQTGFYLLKPKESVNHVKNPTFARDLDNWIPTNVRAIRTNEWSMDSGFSVRLSGSGDLSDPLNIRSYIDTELEGLVGGLSYSASVYVWMSELYDSQDDLMGTISIIQQVRDDNDLVISESELVSERISRFGRWERIGITFSVNAGTTNVFLRLNLRSQEAHYLFSPFDVQIDSDTGNPIINNPAEYIYFDMVQVEQGYDVTTPFHGDTSVCHNCECGGYKWLGVPHNSESYRSEDARDGGTLISLSELGFQMTSHSGHDGMDVTNLSQQYVNKPGSNFQKPLLPSSRVLTFTGRNCAASLEELECQLFGLQDYVLPAVGQCADCSKFLLIYQHGNDCKDCCDNEGSLAMCMTYLGGFSYSRNNLYSQDIVLQFEAHDPIAWFSYPISRSVKLNFAEAISGNKIVKFIAEGGYESYPISQNVDIRTVACLGGSDFLMGGDFDGINAAIDTPNLSIISCGITCAGIGHNGHVNVAESDGNGNVIYGGAFTGYLGIVYGSNQAEAKFDNFPGGEVFSVHAPFWANIVAGTDNGIYIQKTTGEWLSFETNGRVNDLNSDLLGNIYAVGEFTTIDGEPFAYVARFNINNAGCLDIDTAMWESIGYGFDNSMNTIAYDPIGNKFYFGGIADYAIPDESNICNPVIGKATDSKGTGNECNFLYDTPMLFVLTDDNPQILEAGGSIICNMDFTVSTEGDFVASTGGFDNPDIVNLTQDTVVLTIHWPYPVENLELHFANMQTGEGFRNFNILPTSETGFDIINGNFYRANTNTSHILTWDGPITDLTFSYMVFDAGNADGDLEWDRMTFSRIESGNNQQFTFLDEGECLTRLKVGLSNAIAQQFLANCLTQTITSLQKHYVRISATNNKGIAYNFLIGDDNILDLNTYNEAGMWTVDMLINTCAIFPLPCSELNTSFTNEFNQSASDLALYKTLSLGGGVGVDNLLSAIELQCIVLDVTYHAENILINGVAEYNGSNLYSVGAGFETEIYDLIVTNTGELWAGYDGGLRIWNGQIWIEFPGILAGSVIDMSICKNGDIYILTDQDGGHVLPGITSFQYHGNFEQLSGNIVFSGPGTLEYLGEHCTNRIARFCSMLDCDEIMDFEISNSRLSGTRDFNSGVLAGSRLDFWLRKMEQTYSLFISGDNAQTKATLIYREHYWGINALCCSNKQDKPIPYMPVSPDICCHNEFTMHRNPDADDCESEGWGEGDLWLNVVDAYCGGPRLFVNTGQGCPVACGQGGLTGDDALLDDDGNPICP